MSALSMTHVVVLDDAEINVVIAGLVAIAKTDASGLADRLATRLQFGDEYANALDERVQLEARRKQLKAATTANSERIATVNELLDEEWRERGTTSERHVSGKLVHRDRGRVFAKAIRADKDVTPAERQAACDALSNAGLGDFVREDFNTGSLGSYFKEQAQQYDEAQRLLPESERTPRTIADFLPAPCVGFIEVTDNPTISVRS